MGGFPGGAVVESLPANAGDTGSSPGLGGSHMPRSSWAREPQLLSLRVWSLCSATREAAIVLGKEKSPCILMLDLVPGKLRLVGYDRRFRASLVAQWLRVCLPMQGTWVRALVWEDPTCHGATGPVSHNY
ncbi:hypothetical protein J1605_022028 [Eschrichtius robustus]|uniref:Uncharacterized protein n=1 Tax=Eschrichtius robustus TaxID=9764 RepID=A0AB34HEQ1_ESCRO|nr:hypothetical protein J1605_022028 [Eschrichtius robustus]